MAHPQFEVFNGPDFEFDIIPSSRKISENTFAYLSFVITTVCSFKCEYCGEGGEGTASHKTKADIDFIKDRARIAFDYGIRKFRLTGGEPTEHPQFEQIVEFLSSFPGGRVLINTHGGTILRKKSWLQNLGTNVGFAVSLDALHSEYFDEITGTKGRFDSVIDGIKFLSTIGKLRRLNMVVQKSNINEVFSLINFCRGYCL